MHIFSADSPPAALDPRDAAAVASVTAMEVRLHLDVPWDELFPLFMVLRRMPGGSVAPEAVPIQGEPREALRAWAQGAEAGVVPVGDPAEFVGVVVIVETWHQRGGDGRERIDVRRALCELAGGAGFELMRLRDGQPRVRFYPAGEGVAERTLGPMVEDLMALARFWSAT